MATPRTGRPRGRPKGRKNLPKTLEAFVIDSLENPVSAPPPAPKKAARGPWANMTPEERSAYSRKLIAARDPSKPLNNGRKPGISSKLSMAQHRALEEEQAPIIKRMLKKMADKGQLPDDPKAVEALEETLKVLRSDVTAKDKLAAARLLLDFTKAKPSQKIEHTVKTAEDYLDEMADDEDE